MIDKIKNFFKKNNYLFKDTKKHLYILVEKDVVKVLGKIWISSIHMDAYAVLEDYCIKNNFFTIDLSESNITSRLISKLENIYTATGQPMKLIILKEQKVLLSYLVLKYSFELVFVD